MSGMHPTVRTDEDLLGQAAIRETVREAYLSVIGKSTGIAPLLYSAAERAMLPAGALAQALGVANPVRAAALRRGDVVLDLGCGAGVDTILAAQLVGPEGRAIGLDMLPEMLERASVHGAEAGITNVEWVRGELEAVPLPDATVDVALSNGVVNLSPRKSRVFAEIHRVLRAGGRLVAADIVLDDELPPEVFTNPAAWAG